MTYEEYNILVSALYFYREEDHISRREFIAGLHALNKAYSGGGGLKKVKPQPRVIPTYTSKTHHCCCR